jgi:hypothetical protein
MKTFLVIENTNTTETDNNTDNHFQAFKIVKASSKEDVLNQIIPLYSEDDYPFYPSAGFDRQGEDSVELNLPEDVLKYVQIKEIDSDIFLILTNLFGVKVDETFGNGVILD